MGLFRSELRPRATTSDDAVERYLAGLRTALQPDPLFRRRLRGRVMNEFVARREELVRPPRATMGRLGRAVLYASVTLMLGVSTAMAASQGAIPGDPLYPVKRQIEELRLQALPAALHEELVADALAERIEELGRLAELGRWDAVAIHADAVEAEYGDLSAAIAVASVPMERHLVVLGELLDRLPERARSGIERVIHEVDTARREAAPATREPGRVEPGTPLQGGSAPRASDVPRATPEPPGQDDDATDGRGQPADPPRAGSSAKPHPSRRP